MKSKNNLVCAPLPLHWLTKTEAQRGASHPPLFTVWSCLKQHLSDDNLEEILPLSSDIPLCRDWDNVETETVSSPRPVQHSQSHSVYRPVWLVSGWSRHVDGKLPLIGPSTKMDGQKPRRGSMSVKKKKQEPGWMIIFFSSSLTSLSPWVFWILSGLAGVEAQANKPLVEKFSCSETGEH